MPPAKPNTWMVPAQHHQRWAFVIDDDNFGRRKQRAGAGGFTLGPKLACDDQAIGLRAEHSAGAKTLCCDYDCHVYCFVRRQDDLSKSAGWRKDFC